MANGESSPLLASSRSPSPSDQLAAEPHHESTPLLAVEEASAQYGTDDRSIHESGQSTASRRSYASSVASTKRSRRRWPSIVMIALLTVVSLLIIVLGFFVPSAVEEYTKQAAVLEPTNLSLESITTDGVRARIQANFRLDGSRVRNDNVRRIGRVATWTVRQIGTERTTVQVYLPEYGNILLGTADVPPFVIDIRDGHNTAINFVADLAPGDAEGIRTVANDWLEGRLDRIRVQGKANIPLKSGIIPLGTHSVVESLVFEGQALYRSFASFYLGEKTLY